MYDIVAQLIGFVGMALCIGCFQCKSSRLLLLFQLLGNSIYVVHFLMLGAYSGCVSVLILVLSNIPLCVPERPWTRWKGFKWLFSIAFVAACIFTWKDAFSLLPCISSIVFVFTNYTGDIRVIRRAKVSIVGPGWVIYNAYAHSYSGVLSESIGMISAFIALRRFGTEKIK